MSAGRKFAGLWLLAMLFYYRTAIAIILAVLFAFGCYLLVRIRPIGRARRLWRVVLGHSRAIRTRSTVLSNLKREVAVARRSAWQPISDSFLRRFAVDPEKAPQLDEFEYCPYCGSPDTLPKGNTSYICRDCGMMFP